jgi:hypothetical protein
MSRRIFNGAQSIPSPERSQIGRAGGAITGRATSASTGTGKMTTQ